MCSLGSAPALLKRRPELGTPARALKMYLVPGMRGLAVTLRVPDAGWMVRQAPPDWSFISSSHTHCFGSCRHTIGMTTPNH